VQHLVGEGGEVGAEGALAGEPPGARPVGARGGELDSERQQGAGALPAASPAISSSSIRNL
jgi:hypothetical protein